MIQPEIDHFNPESFLPSHLDILEKARLSFQFLPNERTNSPQLKAIGTKESQESLEIERLRRAIEEMDRKKGEFELMIAEMKKRNSGRIFDPKDTERKTISLIDQEIRETQEAIKSQVAYGDQIDDEIRRKKAEVGLDISNFAEMASHEFYDKFGIDEILNKIQQETNKMV